MIIPIDEEWRIATDPMNWIVQRQKKVKREGVYVMEWHNKAYLGSFKQSVEWLAKRLVRESDAVGLVNAIDAVQKVCDRLSNALLDVIVTTEETKGE